MPNDNVYLKITNQMLAVFGYKANWTSDNVAEIYDNEGNKVDEVTTNNFGRDFEVATPKGKLTCSQDYSKRGINGMQFNVSLDDADIGKSTKFSVVRKHEGNIENMSLDVNDNGVEYSLITSSSGTNLSYREPNKVWRHLTYNLGNKPYAPNHFLTYIEGGDNIDSTRQVWFNRSNDVAPDYLISTLPETTRDRIPLANASNVFTEMVAMPRGAAILDAVFASVEGEMPGLPNYVGANPAFSVNTVSNARNAVSSITDTSSVDKINSWVKSTEHRFASEKTDIK